MSSKDKLIGVSLIVLGLLFIGMGVYSIMGSKAKANNKIYTEATGQTVTEQTVIEQYQTNVNVYTETTNQDSEGGTRYIY